MKTVELDISESL